MPAEKIHTRDRTVTVGWQRDGGVQVATLMGQDGQWADLDRHQVNTLIRHLRRARDAAYGRDE